MSIAKSLKKLIIADNQFSDEERVLMALEFCMSRNTSLTKYDLRCNNIGEQGKFTEQCLCHLPTHLAFIRISYFSNRIESDEPSILFRTA